MILTGAVRLISCLAAISLPALPQAASNLFTRAPAGVEEALRQRADTFYALQMQGKFRQAESVVCEASKDAFYGSDKRQWRSAEVAKIAFEDEFRTARVTVLLGAEFTTRAGRMPVTYPATTIWKLEDGNWCFYIPPPSEEAIVTPFGKMKGSGVPVDTQAGTAKSVSVGDVLSALKLSKREMTLNSAGPSSDEILIHNGLPGQLELEVEAGQREGLRWELSKKQLVPKESVTLRVEYLPPDRKPKPEFTLNLRVIPLGQSIPIKITFRPPQELLEKLPDAAKPKQ